MKLTWKIWTWPAKIRALHKALAVANEDITRLRRMVECSTRSQRTLREAMNHHKHQAQLHEAKAKDFERQARGAHRNGNS